MNTPIQYLTDEAGEKIAVVLSIADYQRLMEDIEDLTDNVDRREEPTIAHEEFLALLREDGLIR